MWKSRSIVASFFSTSDKCAALRTEVDPSATIATHSEGNSEQNLQKTENL